MTKLFKVQINIDCTYYAKDKEECEKLVYNDFNGLEMEDDVEIIEITNPEEAEKIDKDIAKKMRAD